MQWVLLTERGWFCVVYFRLWKVKQTCNLKKWCWVILSDYVRPETFCVCCVCYIGWPLQLHTAPELWSRGIRDHSSFKTTFSGTFPWIFSSGLTPDQGLPTFAWFEKVLLNLKEGCPLYNQTLTSFLFRPENCYLCTTWWIPCRRTGDCVRKFGVGHWLPRSCWWNCRRTLPSSLRNWCPLSTPWPSE